MNRHKIKPRACSVHDKSYHSIKNQQTFPKKFAGFSFKLFSACFPLSIRYIARYALNHSFA